MSSSDKFDDGGYAFPTHAAFDNNPGMSLRDYFAGLAMQCYINQQTGQPKVNMEDAAFYAYSQADAMLDVRSKTTPE